MAIPGTVVFVHGWSVRSADTYGELPERLMAEAGSRGVRLETRDIWLSRYVSFRDEVRVEDLSRAFRAAVARDLKDLLDAGKRFACITHSTGGPVVRDWWNRYYVDKGDAEVCPMSHFVMLAPANFGSALAQLGKSRLSRIKTWFQGVEPGTGVLEWLELGSPEAWELNRKWITGPKTLIADSRVFPFVLTGQTIDPKLYDHVNSYTGEPGSDGVVRVASGNLNATWVRLEQEAVRQDRAGRLSAPRLEAKGTRYSPETVFKVIPGRSHSGEDIGILRSVRRGLEQDHPAVRAVLDCLEVGSIAKYDALRARFAAENDVVQEDERRRVHRRVLRRDTVTLTDRYAMVIFRVVDDQGRAVDQFDLKLTASSPQRPEGPPSPDLLPEGFFVDRQRNGRHAGTLSFFVDADLMVGRPPETHPDRPEEVVRPRVEGAPSLGFRIEPHQTSGFVHYLPAEFVAQKGMLDKVVQPNQTTLVEIVLRRVVREGAFRLARLSVPRDDSSFVRTPEGPPIED